MDRKRNAFTMAETLIVLVVLGIIATLVIPNLINKQRETTNKTRLKKAMASYDTAVQKMAINTDIKSLQAFKTWAEGSGESKNCENAVKYFKIAKTTGNDCVFQTTDGIWWNLSEFDRTLIAFKQEDLTSEKAQNFEDRSAFVLVTSFDPNTGAYRVNDLSYEIENPVDQSNVYVGKLFGLDLRNSYEKYLANDYLKHTKQTCNNSCGAGSIRNSNNKSCMCSNGWTSTNKGITYTNYSVYDENGNLIFNSYCPSEDIANCEGAYSKNYFEYNSDGTYTQYQINPDGKYHKFEHDNRGRSTMNSSSCSKDDTTGSNCASYSYYYYEGNTNTKRYTKTCTRSTQSCYCYTGNSTSNRIDCPAE